jgi:MFS family permease
LYALFFADTGLSDVEISVLFAIWSTVGVLAEVPTGALADRFSRRGTLVAAGVCQAVGYVLWTTLPGFAAFAVGFVLWGLGGALGSGSLEALLYDGLSAVGAQSHYARVSGWVTAAELLADLPAAVAATVLFSAGGYALVGWASVGCCLAAAGLAALLPEPPRGPDQDDDATYFETLRAGLAEATSRPAVRAAVVAVALISGLDAFEEYFPLIAADWGVPTALVPLALAAIPLVGAVGAALAGRANGLRAVTLGAVLAASAVLLGAAGLLAQPVGLVAVAVFYGLYRMVLVVVDARLQDRIDGPNRATVTSVAGLGTEFACFAVYAAWALGEVVLVAGLVLAFAVALPLLFRVRIRTSARGSTP